MFQSIRPLFALWPRAFQHHFSAHLSHWALLNTERSHHQWLFGENQFHQTGSSWFHLSPLFPVYTFSSLPHPMPVFLCGKVSVHSKIQFVWSISKSNSKIITKISIQLLLEVSVLVVVSSMQVIYPQHAFLFVTFNNFSIKYSYTRGRIKTKNNIKKFFLLAR